MEFLKSLWYSAKYNMYHLKTTARCYLGLHNRIVIDTLDSGVEVLRCTYCDDRRTYGRYKTSKKVHLLDDNYFQRIEDNKVGK